MKVDPVGEAGTSRAEPRTHQSRNGKFPFFWGGGFQEKGAFSAGLPLTAENTEEQRKRRRRFSRTFKVVGKIPPPKNPGKADKVGGATSSRCAAPDPDRFAFLFFLIFLHPFFPTRSPQQSFPSSNATRPKGGNAGIPECSAGVQSTCLATEAKHCDVAVK